MKNLLALVLLGVLSCLGAEGLAHSEDPKSLIPPAGSRDPSRSYAPSPAAVAQPETTAAPASARTNKTHVPDPVAAAPSFESLDDDDDGELSFLEIPPGHALNMRFIDYDLDGNKKLSRSEFDRFEMAAGYDDEEQ
jgi:hypothetical protein